MGTVLYIIFGALIVLGLVKAAGDGLKKGVHDTFGVDFPLKNNSAKSQAKSYCENGWDYGTRYGFIVADIWGSSKEWNVELKIHNPDYDIPNSNFKALSSYLKQQYNLYSCTVKWQIIYD